ncbi:MAG: hypothetical protein HXY43_21490 [Fischerella sp.]|uniref:hypothetical protein n=1 Tax=Fischerella sp. TaxID=1191 RepID=UPI0017A49B4B|nr:hypothetical protein [Fischerella sp.]NWF61757.1 hypothetical protein [Fischerella sp.]
MRQALISSTPNPQPSLTITLESAGIFLGSLVSVSILIGIIIKIVSKVNSINSEIKDLKEDLNENKKIFEQVKTLEREVHGLDKRLDIHLQDYSGYKDVLLLAVNGNKEAIAHKWKRTEEEFEKTNSEVRELQRYLQQRGDFKIRE